MLAGNISSKSNLTQQDPSDLSTSQSLKTYYFRDETIHRDRMSQACGKTELLHKCFQLPPSFHLRWLHLESAELFCRVLFHPVIVKPKSAPNYCFPELPPCTRGSSGPPHTSSFTMATLAEPFHPSCLKASAGSLSITSVALSTWASAPLRFPSPCVALQMPSYTLYNTCCGFPAYLSISRIRYTLKTFVLEQWKSTLSPLHSKEKLLPQLYQLMGKEQGKSVKPTRLTLNTLQNYCFESLCALHN